MQKEPHVIKPRKVAFDLSNSDVHWLPDDPFSSHMINGIHLLLPAGEFWFCRVFNKALPLVKDEVLKANIKGFIFQEGAHAKVHVGGQSFLESKGYDVSFITHRARWFFEKLLGDSPRGLSLFKWRWVERAWIRFRVGTIATIEHFTGLAGNWALNSKGWNDGDVIVADLFRWHLAEEVEHRSVAFDLYRHLCKTRVGFYLGRQFHMLWVFPLFVWVMIQTFRLLTRQDKDPQVQALSRWSILKIIRTVERIGKSTDHVPSMTTILKKTIVWLSPWYDPVHEGNTQQALDYFEKMGHVYRSV